MKYSIRGFISPAAKADSGNYCAIRSIIYIDGQNH
jgi:hypothetical protein